MYTPQQLSNPYYDKSPAFWKVWHVGGAILVAELVIGVALHGILNHHGMFGNKKSPS